MKKMSPGERRLVKVSHCRESPEILWELLKERPAYANISHRAMPEWRSHLSFVSRYPYRAWYLIETAYGYAGAIYFTRRNEIGIHIFKAHQRKGHATWAVNEVMRMWRPHVLEPRGTVPAGFYANISPGNEQSKEFFRRLGFEFVQETHRLDVAGP